MDNIEQSLALTANKSDIVFYRAFTERSHLARLTLLVQLLKLAILVALIPIDTIYLDVSYGTLIICLIINIVATCLGLLHYLLLVCSVYSNLDTYIYIAILTGHTIPTQPIADRSSVLACVSQTIFLAEDCKREVDLSEEERATHKKVTKNMIENAIKLRHGWVGYLSNLYELMSFASMIYSIVVLATTGMPLADTVVLSVYVAVVGLFTTLHLIIACVVMVVAPVVCLLLCLFCCCCCCCCPQNSFSTKAITVVEKQASNVDVVNSEGTCSICQMAIALNQKIYVLPCSEKHVFHGECLRQWTRIKTTCPLCRAEIPTSPQQQQEEAVVSDEQIVRASLEQEAAA